MKYEAKQNKVNRNCRCLYVGYCDLQNWLDGSIDKLCAEYLVKEVLLTA